MLEAIVFGVVACGLMPRSALEEADSGDNRLDKIIRLIRASAYGIHDLSRTQSNPPHGNEREVVPVLPRFNMPFELGLDIAWKRHSDDPSHKKQEAAHFRGAPIHHAEVPVRHRGSGRYRAWGRSRDSVDQGMRVAEGQYTPQQRTRPSSGGERVQGICRGPAAALRGIRTGPWPLTLPRVRGVRPKLDGVVVIVALSCCTAPTRRFKSI